MGIKVDNYASKITKAQSKIDGKGAIPVTSEITKEQSGTLIPKLIARLKSTPKKISNFIKSAFTRKNRKGNSNNQDGILKNDLTKPLISDEQDQPLIEVGVPVDIETGVPIENTTQITDGVEMGKNTTGILYKAVTGVSAENTTQISDDVKLEVPSEGSTEETKPNSEESLEVLKGLLPKVPKNPLPETKPKAGSSSKKTIKKKEDNKQKPMLGG